VSKVASFISILAAGVALVACSPGGQSDKRASQGHGLLPRPSTLSEHTARVGLNSYAFHEESPAVYTRVLFDTDAAPDFRLQVREFSLPARQELTTVHVKGDALLEMRTDHGRLMIGDREQEWKQGATVMVPSEVPIRLANPTSRELIVRLHVLESK
jgi:hypothetical protein